MHLQSACARPQAVQRTYHYLEDLEARMVAFDAEPDDDATVALRAELLDLNPRHQLDRGTTTRTTASERTIGRNSR